MKLLPLVFIAALLNMGCKNPMSNSVVQITNGVSAESRVQNMGIVRLRSTYSLASGNFRSTCTGTLLHGGDQSFRECVVLSAAHCFKNLPRGAEHSIEFLDSIGNVQKIYRANAIFIHPEFTSQDAKISMEQSSVDAALVKFNCSLPASIKSARVIDFNQVPIASALVVAGFGLTKSEHAMAAENEAKGLGRIVTEDAPMATRLMQTSMQLRSVDFPMLKSSGPGSQIPGVFSLIGMNGQSSCEGDSGGPAFFDSGRELLLVASTSAGPAFCERATARYTLASPLIPWMEEVVGKGVVSFVRQLNNDNPTARVSSPSTTTPPQPISAPARPLAVPEGIPVRLPSVSIPTTKPIQPKITKMPVPPPTIPAPTVLPVARATVPPLPEPEDLDEVVKVCTGRKFIANSKTRVWGTVIKLIDKDSTLISDDTMKCDFPNESEVCLTGNPVATGTGNSRAELLEDVELAGCGKFKAGKSIYIFMPDFVAR